MSRLYLPLLLLFLLVLQGVVFNFIPNNLIQAGWMFIVHWVFIFLVLFTLFYDLEDTYYSVFFAILFGLMIDVVYTSVIGVYMFSYAIVIYFVHGLRKILHANFYVAFLLSIVSVGLVDFIIYLIYTFIGISDMGMDTYFVYRLLPTIAINLFSFIILHVMFKKKLVRWSNQRFDVKSST